MSAIGSLTKIILTTARCGIGLVAGYGVLNIMKGHSEEDLKTRNDGIATTLAALTILSITFAIEKILK